MRVEEKSRARSTPRWSAFRRCCAEGGEDRHKGAPGGQGWHGTGIGVYAAQQDLRSSAGCTGGSTAGGTAVPMPPRAIRFRADMPDHSGAPDPLLQVQSIPCTAHLCAVMVFVLVALAIPVACYSAGATPSSQYGRLPLHSGQSTQYTSQLTLGHAMVSPEHDGTRPACTWLRGSQAGGHA